MDVRYLAPARAEAFTVAEFYEREAAGLGADFFSVLDDAIEMILTAPGMGPTYESGTRRMVLPRFPYSVVYEIHADHILIVAWPTSAGARDTGVTDGAVHPDSEEPRDRGGEDVANPPFVSGRGGERRIVYRKGSKSSAGGRGSRDERRICNLKGIESSFRRIGTPPKEDLRPEAAASSARWRCRWTVTDEERAHR